MRAFLGIPCPDSRAEKLSELFSELTDRVSLKPVKPQNYHITVKFLGDVDKELCDKLSGVLDDKLEQFEGLQLELRYAGVFPNPGNPRVIWAGAGPEEPLKKLNEVVAEAAFERGIEREDREYHPHLTLGRIKNKLDNPQPVIDWLKKYGNDEFGRIESPALALYESNLTSHGPQYRELNRWKI